MLHPIFLPTLVGDGVLDVPHPHNPFRYSGEYYDEETGFIYLRARYYDPTIGRFISEDPIRDGLNWYAYANNNPVMFVDPSGYYKEDDEEEIEKAATSFGYSRIENGYDNLYLAVTNSQGRTAFGTVAELFANPGTYTLGVYDCDSVTASVVRAAGKFYDDKLLPIDSFESTKLYHTNPWLWAIMKIGGGL